MENAKCRIVFALGVEVSQEGAQKGLRLWRRHFSSPSEDEFAKFCCSLLETTLKV